MRDIEELKKELESTKRKYELAIEMLRKSLPEEQNIYVTGRRWIGTLIRSGGHYTFRPSIQGKEAVIDHMEYPVFIMEETEHVLS